MTPILERLPVRAERSHSDPDGTFPHYQPNPLLEENRQFIISEVTKRAADLGIAWDGDAYRCSSSMRPARSCRATSSRR